MSFYASFSKALDPQRVSLAQPSMRTGTGAIGYRSIAHLDSANAEWIQIALSEAMTIDQVVFAAESIDLVLAHDLRTNLVA